MTEPDRHVGHLHATQVLLDRVQRLGAPLFTDDEGEWFAVVPNDPDELGNARSPIGLKIKIGGEPGAWVLLDVGSYNR